MGWDYKHVPSPVDRARECRAMLDDRYEVLKDSLVGSIWYAAIRNKETGIVHALVVPTHVTRSGWYNFGVKWMDETYGPCHYDCPETILKLLSPTASAYANEWRRKCRSNRAEKRRGKDRTDILRTAPYGARFLVTLSDGRTRTVIKKAPGYKFKTWWLLVENDCKYIPKRYIISAVPAV